MDGKDIAKRWYGMLDGVVLPMLASGFTGVVIAPAGTRYVVGMAALAAVYIVLLWFLFVSPPTAEPVEEWQGRLDRRPGRGWFRRNKLLNEAAGAIFPRGRFVRRAWLVILLTAGITSVVIADVLTG